MKVLAIIPARAGSKGIPDKNIIRLDNKPLITYTIESALESKLLSKIIVSSDGPKILDIASGYEGIHLHDRDADIAGDKSPVAETIAEILQREDEFDAVMLLQPTSPIRTGRQIDQAISLFARHPDCNSLISVVPMDDVHPARMYWKNSGELLDPILDSHEQSRRQDIPVAFYRNGSIYLTRALPFLKSKQVMQKPSIGFEMPYSHLLNVDDPRDLIVGEALIKAWKEGKL